MRQYNPDLGRWFAPDPYGQYASPYLAMANNPVSFTDPDGGWVSFPVTGGYNEFRGKKSMDLDRSRGSGAFSREWMQKRYDDEFKNLTKHYMDYNYGGRKDVGGYLNAVNALNSTYMGLNQLTKTALAYKSGGERMTASEQNLNQLAVARNSAVIASQFHSYFDTHITSDVTHGLGDWAEKKRLNPTSISTDLLLASLGVSAPVTNNSSDISQRVVEAPPTTDKMDVLMEVAEDEETEMIQDEACEEKVAVPGECVYTKPDNIDISTATGNDVARTYITAMQYEIMNGEGTSRDVGKYFDGIEEGQTYSYKNVEIGPEGSKIRIPELSFTYEKGSFPGSFAFSGSDKTILSLIPMMNQINSAFDCRDKYYGPYRNDPRPEMNTSKRFSDVDYNFRIRIGQ